MYSPVGRTSLALTAAGCGGGIGAGGRGKFTTRGSADASTAPAKKRRRVCCNLFKSGLCTCINTKSWEYKTQHPSQNQTVHTCTPVGRLWRLRRWPYAWRFRRRQRRTQAFDPCCQVSGGIPGGHATASHPNSLVQLLILTVRSVLMRVLRRRHPSAGLCSGSCQSCCSSISCIVFR